MKIANNFDTAIECLRQSDNKSEEKLEEINLSGQRLSKSQWKELIAAFKINAGQSTNLKKLNLANTELDDETAAKLSTALQNRTLEIIDADNNNLSIVGAAFLLEIPSLKMLKLAGNRIGSAASPAEEKEEKIAISPSLQYLDLSFNELSDMTSAQVLTQSLSLASSLAYLKAGNNDFGAAGVTVLANVLTKLLALQGIELASNEIDDEATLALAENLIQHGELRILNLSHNKITSEGANALAGLLPTLLKLKELNLSHNQIDDKGAEYFADALSRPIALEHLDLSANRIGNDGSIALAKGLVANKKLVILNLVSNPITDENAFRAFMIALKTNRSLLRLGLPYNASPADAKSAINQRLAYNLAVQQKSTHNWIRVILVITFINANQENPLKYSILSLITEIMKSIDTGEKRFIDFPQRSEEKFRELSQGLSQKDDSLTAARYDAKDHKYHQKNLQQAAPLQQASPSSKASELTHHLDKIKQTIEESKLLSALKDSTRQACSEYKRYYNRITLSVWHRHGETGQTRASNFDEKIKNCTQLNIALNILYIHLSRRESPFNNAGRLYNHSFDTYLLGYILGDAVLANYFQMINIPLMTQLERENARGYLLEKILTLLAVPAIRPEAPKSDKKDQQQTALAAIPKVSEEKRKKSNEVVNDEKGLGREPDVNPADSKMQSELLAQVDLPHAQASHSARIARTIEPPTNDSMYKKGTGPRAPSRKSS